MLKGKLDNKSLPAPPVNKGTVRTDSATSPPVNPPVKKGGKGKGK